MSHECLEKSCSHGGSSHTHGGCHPGCQCACHQQHCQCSCHDHEHDGDHHVEKLLELADEAWLEVVKDKLKEQVLKYSGKHIEELAQIVGEGNHLRWKEHLETKKNDEEFEERLRNFFFKTK